jgi:gamma-glutamylcysteine synthetase
MITYLQVGLLYDEESLQSILDMTFDWTKEEREMLRRKVICTLYTSVIQNIVVLKIRVHVVLPYNFDSAVEKTISGLIMYVYLFI